MAMVKTPKQRRSASREYRRNLRGRGGLLPLDWQFDGHSPGNRQASLLGDLGKAHRPIRGAQETHVCSGWVHKGYEDLMMELFRNQGSLQPISSEDVKDMLTPTFTPIPSF